MEIVMLPPINATGTVRLRIAGHWRMYPVRRCEVDGKIEYQRAGEWRTLTKPQRERVIWDER